VLLIGFDAVQAGVIYQNRQQSYRSVRILRTLVLLVRILRTTMPLGVDMRVRTHADHLKSEASTVLGDSRLRGF